MKQYRTTLDGVNYFEAPPANRNTQPKRPAQPLARCVTNAAEKFRRMRQVIDDSRMLEPEDLKAV